MKVIRDNIRDFNLQHIFECGQCFRWNREADGSYTGVALGKAVNLAFYEDGPGSCCGRLELDNATEEEFEALWRPYLDLERDYGGIKALLAADPVMAEAISHGPGIRILRQDKWETLVSFILSQNSNIPRIKKSVELLCSRFGPQVGEYAGQPRFGMPGPETLAALTAEALADCRLGYRTGYLLETARAVAADGGARLAATAHMPSEEAYAYLLGLPGVGPKVANCVLLFSMEGRDRFPIDVWVRRAMHRLYGIAEKDTEKMAAFARETFGEHGGLAQQYLFYYIKEKREA